MQRNQFRVFVYQLGILVLISDAWGLAQPFAVPRALIWLIPWALIFGGAIELLQPLVSRSGQWADFWADTWGIGVGLLVGIAMHYFMILRLRR